MINILIPACGTSDYFCDSYWPQNTIEIEGKPMIQYAIDSFQDISDKRFIFALLQSECNKFHTDDVVRLLAGKDSEVIKLGQMSGGALCTSLMAIKYIDNDGGLIISNNDQLLEYNVREIIDYFEQIDADAGVVCFESTNPRWNYVRVEGESVVEAAEKRPLSKCAIAGFYYFKKGKEYIHAAKNAILKDRSYEGKYYHVAAINEMILEGKKVAAYMIPNANYHAFYSPKQIEVFERRKEA